MFDNNKLGEIRPNQLITTFGPGAIVDAVKDSVTILDLNYWKEKGKKIIDGRLASYLSVDCFYMPRTSYSGDIPATSFPYMHVCSSVKCGRIFDVRDNFDLDRYLKFGVTCPFCHKPAYPSRFITICENGHMNDFSLGAGGFIMGVPHVKVRCACIPRAIHLRLQICGWSARAERREA